MRAIRDLSGALPPVVMDLFYNGTAAADSVTKRYKGSLVKVMNYDSITNGLFLTWAGETTAMENIFGILEEEQPTSGNYLPNNATYGMTRRKITPILPSTVIRAQYVELDADGTTANSDTTATAPKDSATFTVTITTTDRMIGGWVYFLNGTHANYLHYILNNDGTTATFATAVTHAVVATDTFLVIQPACDRTVDFNATYTDIKSDIADDARTDPIVGLDHWIEAPGLGMQKLHRNIHDGLCIPNARFYHDFLMPGNQTYTNVFTYGIKES